MLHQPLNICNEIRGTGLRLVIGMAEYRRGFPEPHEGDTGSERRHQEEGQSGRQVPGDVARSERSRKRGDVPDDIPQHGEPPRHEFFLAHKSDQALIGRANESGQQDHRKHPDQESPVGAA
jgi:hypothetical protein